MKKIYPTKKVKYSGTKTLFPGQVLVYMPDGSVRLAEEVFAGLVENCQESCSPDEVSFYCIPEKINGGENNRSL